MTTLDDIITAYRAIEDAQTRYRNVLRSGIEDGVRQVDICQALGRTRESIRRDAMAPEELARIRLRDRQRKNS